MAIVAPDKVEVRPTNLSEGDSTMTATTMALAELAEKGADIDVLRQMVQFMAQRLMELDVEGRCGAGSTRRRPSGSTAVTATATACGRLAPARLS